MPTKSLECSTSPAAAPEYRKISPNPPPQASAALAANNSSSPSPHHPHPIARPSANCQYSEVEISFREAARNPVSWFPSNPKLKIKNSTSLALPFPGMLSPNPRLHSSIIAPLDHYTTPLPVLRSSFSIPHSVVPPRQPGGEYLTSKRKESGVQV